MPASALAQLHVREAHPDIPAYLDRIQGIPDPFGSRFRVHGGRTEALEGAWEGDLVLVELPDPERARAWYDSAAYQEILPLRTAHIDGRALLVEGVPDDYDPATKAAAMRAAAAGRAE